MKARIAKELSDEFYNEATLISLDIILNTIQKACIFGYYSCTVPYISEENKTSLEKLGYTLTKRKMDGILGMYQVYDIRWE